MRRILMGAVASFLLANTANAEDLTIGSRIEAVMDPHYFFSSNNIQFYRHYLGFLTVPGADSEVMPWLATEWEQDDEGWTFHLREAKFTDGSEFDAADVVASYKRARDYPKAAGTYAGLFAGVTDIVAVDPRTVRMTTDGPVPTLPFAMTQVSIIPSEIAEGATQGDFNSASAQVSIGPFMFSSHTSGQQLVLERNPDFWGDAPEWDKVTFRFLPDAANRVAALLAGDVDLIDGVPPEFVERITATQGFQVHSGPSMRNVYINLDTGRDQSPFVRGKDGSVLNKNPLKDLRVRQAMSLAVDRQAISDRVMVGQSFPSGQLVSPGIGGHSDAIPVPAPDPDRARALLSEAGYPDGFAITLQCPNDRYVNDARICQALGQMFSRIGIATTVQTYPSSAYFGVVNPSIGEGGSVFLSSWSAAGSGEADVLTFAFHTFDPESKTGSWNMGRYSSPELDELIEAFNVTQDRDQRLALEAQAMELTMKDVAAIPLHDQSVVVATRAGLTYTTTIEDTTNALQAHAE